LYQLLKTINSETVITATLCLQQQPSRDSLPYHDHCALSYSNNEVCAGTCWMLPAHSTTPTDYPAKNYIRKVPQSSMFIIKFRKVPELFRNRKVRKQPSYSLFLISWQPFSSEDVYRAVNTSSRDEGLETDELGEMSSIVIAKLLAGCASLRHRSFTSLLPAT